MGNQQGGIYCIVNLDDGHGTAYIGSTNNLTRRWNQHRYVLRNGICGNAFLQRSWNKYGETAFRFHTLEYINEEHLLIDKEQLWYNRFAETGRTFNSGKFVDAPNRGVKFGEKSRLNMSLAHIGNRHTEETKRKMSKSRRGRKKSAEHKEKIGDSQTKAPYPALVHADTKEIIPAGYGINKLCRRLGLYTGAFRAMVSGNTKHHHGWMLLKGGKQDHGNEKPYPAFKHKDTKQIIPAGCGLSRMCRQMGLDISNMHLVANGSRKHHVGWELLNSKYSDADEDIL